MTPPTALRALVAALLAPALAACSSIGGAPIGEAAELLTMGSSRELREPLRTPRGTSRVLVFALDGVGDDDLRRALREGRMPILAGALGAAQPGGGDLFAHAYAVPGALSVLPSTTTAAWASLFTGEPPARTGVPGNEWFVREERRFHAPVPITVASRSEATRLFTDELMSRLLRAPTVYERADVRAHVSLHPVFRGADLVTFPNLAAFGDLLGAVVEATAGSGLDRSRQVQRETDLTSAASLVNAIEKRGVPDLQVVYFPGIDLHTHVATDPLASQQRYLAEVTDSAIGRVLDAYRGRGVLDDTHLLVVADHGHTPVLPDDRHSLGTEGADEPAEVLRRAGFRVRPFTLSVDADEEDYQAVLAYQGAMAYLYLADRSTCAAPGERCDWSRPPRLREDVLPAARAFAGASRTGAGVPELRGALDLVLAREPRAPGRDALPFQVLDGDSLVPLGDYLRRHPRPDLPRLEERLAGLAAGPYGHRAGDVLLLARFGAGLPPEERFYFGPEYRSEHGSPTAQDSRVPLLVAHPRRSGAELRQRVEAAVGRAPDQLDVARLIEALLGRP